MLVDKPIFITPHAMHQFKERVARWDDNDIICWLNHKLQRLPDEIHFKSGALYYKLQFGSTVITAVVQPGEQDWPSVVTVIGDTERVDRYLSWRGKSWTQKDAHRLRYLKGWGFNAEQCSAIIDKPLGMIVKRWGKGGSRVLPDLCQAK